MSVSTQQQRGGGENHYTQGKGSSIIWLGNPGSAWSSTSLFSLALIAYSAPPPLREKYATRASQETDKVAGTTRERGYRKERGAIKMSTSINPIPLYASSGRMLAQCRKVIRPLVNHCGTRSLAASHMPTLSPLVQIKGSRESSRFIDQPEKMQREGEKGGTARRCTGMVRNLNEERWSERKRVLLPTQAHRYTHIRGGAPCASLSLETRSDRHHQTP